ncbi:type II secretion system protein [bacterium]|nr:type II secretion system protein [bacterium]
MKLLNENKMKSHYELRSNVVIPCKSCEELRLRCSFHSLAMTGFTLAEVLITLGIIGVVAALTIPTLIANINGQRYRSQFKKTISTLNQAVRMNKANHDWDFADLELCQSANDHPENVKSICAIINGNLKGVNYQPYNLVGEVENKDTDYHIDFATGADSGDFNGSIEGGGYYQLADGSIFLYRDGTNCTKKIGETVAEGLEGSTGPGDDTHMFLCKGYIDVNGKTLPNKEVKCSGDATTGWTPETPCVVKNSDITDVFPVVFHDSTIEPATNASAYVLNNTK